MANTTKIQRVKITEVKPNPNNPRIIKDDKFKKLVNSIISFPQMLEIRPIVVNNEMIILGGNMRLRACQEAGLKEVPIIKASELTEEQQREFTIKDNVGFGEWDWDLLANEWSDLNLEDWGINVPKFIVEDEIPASGSMAESLEQKLEVYQNASIKQIVLYYELEDYEYVINKLNEIAKEQGLEDNSSVIKFLIDKFINK
jgi:hypothetical protein